MAEQLYVYEIVDPDQITRHQSALLQVMFPEKGSLGRQELFRIDPRSGQVSYFDHSRLWKNAAANTLIQSADQALIHFKAWYKLVLQRLQQYRTRAASAGQPIPDLLPSQITPAVSQALDNSERFDHWFLQFSIQLPVEVSGGRAESVIDGASLEVRISPDGHIIGFKSRWRPVVRRFKSDLLAPTGDHYDLYFQYQGDTCPQKYLAPSYAYYDPDESQDGHEHTHSGEFGGVSPAVKQAMNVFLIKYPATGGGVALKPHVFGEAHLGLERKLSYSWTVFKVAAAGDHWQSSPTGHSQNYHLVEGGTEHVFVEVTDASTGATAVAHDVVFPTRYNSSVGVV